MREEAHKRIGHLYPKVEVTPEMVRERPDLKAYEGRELTVIAWLWARTVKSPNPAFAEVDVPLASTFMLSIKKGKEAYVAPVIEGRGYRFTVRVGTPADADAAKAGTKLSRGANFRCLMSGTPIAGEYIKSEGRAGRMGSRLMAIVAEGDRKRVYLSPTPKHEAAAHEAKPVWVPETLMPNDRRWFSPPIYGFPTFGDLFTRRQLVALTTFSDLVGEAMERAYRDHMAARAPGQHQAVDPAGSDGGRYWTGEARAPEQHETGGHGRPGQPPFEHLPLRDGDDHAAPPDSQPQKGEQTQREPEALGAANNEKPLRDGGTGARAYAEAVGVYLGIALSRLTDISNALCRWEVTKTQVRNLFGRQAVPMIWDFAENNVFGQAAGDYQVSLGNMAKSLEHVSNTVYGAAVQDNAQIQLLSNDKIVSTDPPYYDNIGYADLSDFFYVWLRRSLKLVFPELFATLAVPKAEELVATPYRHGSREVAETFFLNGMTQAMRRLSEQAHPGFPLTIYYAFKQSERKGDTGIASTGWETFLNAVIRSGFAVTGTWPMRTELRSKLNGIGVNALASSIVLVCRRRPDDAPTATRREYLDALRSELPQALRLLQTGNIAPVDLAQAAIGPGMAVYTRYAKVLDAQGTPISVREALALINQILDEVLAEQEGDIDADSRWALDWFDQYGFDAGDYGAAETLSKAKNTSVSGMVEAGILQSRAGKVSLLRPQDLPADWDPENDARLTTWEMVHHLVRVLESGGEADAADLLRKLRGGGEAARELCYRLYALCERKKRPAEALAYNGLVRSWPEISRLARMSSAEQGVLFGEAGAEGS